MNNWILRILRVGISTAGPSLKERRVKQEEGMRGVRQSKICKSVRVK